MCEQIYKSQHASCLEQFLFFFYWTLCISATYFLVRFLRSLLANPPLLHFGRTKQSRVENFTLSPSAEDARRREQNPTGDPSGPARSNHGPRTRRRATGAPSTSPRWGHVAVGGHARAQTHTHTLHSSPRKSPV